MMETTRRAFVTASLCLLAGGAVYLVILRRQVGGGDTRYELKLADSFRDLESVKLIGKAALEILPEERDIDRLITLIAPERGLESLRREIHEQYRRGEVRELQGWPLSLTELRIFALVAQLEITVNVTPSPVAS